MPQMDACILQLTGVQDKVLAHVSKFPGLSKTDLAEIELYEEKSKELIELAGNTLDASTLAVKKVKSFFAGK